MKKLYKKSEIKKVKVIPVEKRIVPELIIGNHYYYCSGTYEILPCELIEIRENGHIIVKILSDCYFRILHNNMFNKGKRYSFDELIITYTIFPDEIGLTPLQAMQHR